MNERTSDESLQILLVEDNPTDALLLQDALEQVRGANITLTLVKRLDEALARLGAEYFDAVLLDLGLPDSSGLETFTRTQSHYPSVPILVLTGLDDETLALTAVRDGAQDYLVKGKLDTIMLARTIRYAIERKRTAEKLVSSELGYRRLFEAAQDGIFILDAETGQITEANSYLEKLLGYSTGEFIGKRLWEISPFRDKQANEAAFRTLQEKSFIRYEDLPLATKDGRFIDVEFVSNVYGVGDKKVIQCSIRDISERKQAEEKLRQSEERYRAFIAASTEAIWRFELEQPIPLSLSEDEQLEHLYLYGYLGECNDTMAQMYGFSSPQELVGARLADLVVPSNPANIEYLRTLIRSGYRLRNAESCELDRYGQTKYFQNNLVGIIENGAVQRGWGTQQDITERKQYEKDLRLSTERFQILSRATNDVIWDWNLLTDEVWWNEGMENLFGYDKEDIEPGSISWTKRIHSDDLDRVNRSIKGAIQNGQQSWYDEYRFLKADGSYAEIFDRGFIILDENGRSQRMIGSMQDITARKRAEDERDRFFSLSLDMLCVVSMDGCFKRVNPAFTEILGFAEAELLAKPYIDFVHPDDLAPTQEASISSTEGHSIRGFENRYRTKSGSWRWLEWKSVTIVKDGLIYAAARDITERKEAEAALLGMRDELEVRVHERTTELAQANEDLQVQIKVRESAEAETRTRARQQEAVAELGHRALTDVDIDTLLAGATALVAATLEVEISSVLEFMQERNELCFRAGTGWDTNIIGQTVTADAASQAGYALLQDAPMIVTDLRTETRFKPSSRLLERGMVSGMTVIIRGYEQPYGTLGAHTTRPRHFAVDDVHFLQSMANILAAAIEQRRIATEIRELNTQLEASNEQLRIEDLNQQMTLAALQEGAIVLEEAKQEAERANRAKSEFLSRMSHELRTPLNAILGFGQILEMRNTDADPKLQHNVQHILKAGRHLLDLINEVLDIARIEAGHLSLSPEPVEVGYIIRDTLNIVRPLAEARQINLSDETQGKRYVVADQQRLKQVLLNLLSNAVKYNCEGGNVSVSFESIGDDPATGVEGGGLLRVLVRDTGPGLTPEEMARLFVPFERLSAARTQIEGTGIGLSLCRRLVEAMGGQVGVESKPGEGSTFWLELPLAQDILPLKGAAENTFAINPVPPAFDNPRTVLCIEDNLSNINLIEHVLADIDGQIQLIPAMQGNLGLELALQHQPDLILLDVNLPDIMGDVVLNRLKINPKTKDIPVIVLSADATSSQIERLLSGGAIHYLTKPLDIGLFLDILKKTLA